MSERDGRPPTVYYLAPDFPQPSWGVGLLYHHVRLLARNGVAARVLHHRAPFRLDWLEVEVPVDHLDNSDFAPGAADVLVVPEVLAAEGAALPFPGRRLVFVQGTFLILGGLGGAVDYPSLGYSAAIAILPHARAVLERHFGLSPAIVPPFVADYFFARPEELAAPRRKRVLLVPKDGYRAAGFDDYDVARRLLARRCRVAGAGEGSAGDDAPSDPSAWELVEVSGLPHREVAELMRNAAFLVSVNSLEGFNTTVPEAMAAGCLPLCYEGFGPRDFLVDGGNAFVFPNHHVYPLVDTLFDLIDRYDQAAAELASLRARAHATAERFREEATEAALVAHFRDLLGRTE